ncbi:MAG: hypothetical protein IIY21_09750 [Clostridiales bacterium]|nr:hypothetical protein [Clostridiales bacterium]
MTEREIKDKWLAYEFWLFVMPYLVMYGEKYCREPMNSWQIQREFVRQWEIKSQEEKQARFNQFYRMLKQCEEEGDDSDRA